MKDAPEHARLTGPSGPDHVSDGDMVMTILASGGQILRHWTQARPPAIPLRFTLHAHPDGDGTDLDRAVVRALMAHGLIELGKMAPNIDVPRALHATAHGVHVAVRRVTAAYLAAIERHGPQAVSLSSRQRELVHRLHGDRELRLQQYAQDAFRLTEYPPLAEYPSPRRFDAEPLINIGFLDSADRQADPVVWRLADAGASWADAHPDM